MYNKGFTLAESIFVLAITSFLLLLLSTHAPHTASLPTQLALLQEILLQTQLEAIFQKKEITFEFRMNSLCIEESCYAYENGITSDSYSMHYHDNGTISQAKTICFYKANQQLCMYFQLGSGYIDIR